MSNTLTLQGIDPSILRLYSNNEGEILRFEFNGDIYYKGKLIENNEEITEGFREFLTTQGFGNIGSLNKQIKDLVKQEPNDQILGYKIRQLINK